MYPSNLAPTHGTSGVVDESFMECADWRSQLQAELRETSVNYLTDTLKKHLPFSGPEGLQEIERIALSFEDNIYTTSISQSDYIRKITLKRLFIQNQIPNAMTSNVASNSVNPSDLASKVMQQLNHQGQPQTTHGPSNYALPEQQQHMMSQRMQGLSLDSTAQTSNPNGGDLQQEMYQKIQAMKDLYLHD